MAAFDIRPGEPPPRNPHDIAPGHVPPPPPGHIAPGQGDIRHPADIAPGHVPPRRDPGPPDPDPPKPDPAAVLRNLERDHPGALRELYERLRKDGYIE